MWVVSCPWLWLPLLRFLVTVCLVREATAQLPGSWEVLLENAGIASMHSAVTHFGNVVLLDRTDIGASQIDLPSGKCRNDREDLTLKHDCTAHSVLFDPATNTVRPLMILTDSWCSSGQFLSDGTLINTGGDFDGYTKIRRFVPCPSGGSCDWEELTDVKLAEGRWYATNQLLPDGRMIVIGGRNQFTAEFVPASSTGPIELPFLTQTLDRQMDNLYPYVHLLPDGNLFIFANVDAILYDYVRGEVVRNYPKLPGNPRNYPSAGSSVMLALEGGEGYATAEIVVCGGAEYGTFMTEDVGATASGSCGRITATAEAPSWGMESMPFVRVMGDMVMLPTGDVMIINGAQAGSQGFELATEPCLNPVLYQPAAVDGLRFMVLTPSTTPRMYHSTANLLPDGRLLLAGSNPHYFYNFSGLLPTQLRLEAFSPEYLGPSLASLRPLVLGAPELLTYGADFDVHFSVPLPLTGIVEVNLASAPFVTHSFSQGQRLLKLVVSAPTSGDKGTYVTSATAPPSPLVAPPSYYMLFLVNQGIPSAAVWVQLISAS